MKMKMKLSGDEVDLVDPDQTQAFLSQLDGAVNAIHELESVESNCCYSSMLKESKTLPASAQKDFWFKKYSSLLIMVDKIRAARL